jgi:hypothetical protein
VEATVGLWSVPPNTYLALGAPGDVTARVKAELSASYYGFSATRGLLFRQYASIAKIMRAFKVHHKRQPVYDDLMSILTDGGEHG